tara:strand:+ start:4377 stop:6548 length:2172 start_codon:yes stop_codon:yes gene_type:complete
MNTVELYIEGVRVDLFKDESITLTDSIQNINDISKVYSPFTQRFSLPASPTNSKLFKHYYNNDIINGFDARFRVDSLIKMNGSDFRSGQIVLNSIDLRDNKAYTYKIVFYSDTVLIKELFGEDNLDALEPLSVYDFSRSGTNMEDAFRYGLKFNNVVATSLSDRNITLPLVSLNKYYGYDPTDSITYGNLYSDSWFTPNTPGAELGLQDQLKPAIKSRLIIEAIQDHYDVEFNMTDEVINGKTIKSFFGSRVFDELYLWLHREATSSTLPEEDPPVWGVNFDFYGAKWNLGNTYYNYLSGSLPSTFLDSAGKFTVNQGEVAAIRVILKNTISDFLFNVTVVDKISGEIIWTQTNVSNLAAVNNTLTIRDITSGTLESRVYDLEIRTQTPTQTSWESITATALSITLTDTDGITSIGNWQSDFGGTSFPVTNFPDIWIQNYVPKMRVLDYLTTLLKMFNLTAYSIRGSKKIYIQTLDDYMTIGNEYNISKYIDVNKNTVDRNIPFSNINFEYAPAITQPSLRFINANGLQMGNLKYSAPEKYDGKTFTLQVPSQRESLINIKEYNTIIITGIVYGWWVNQDIPAKTVLGKPYFFFNRRVDTTTKPILSQQWTHYNAPSNVSETGSHTLNFGIEIDEYTDETNENSLFSRFYSQYIIQSFEEQSRIVKFTAMLPMNILLNYQLNDTLIINGQAYYINSIKTNLTTQKSELELLTKQTNYTASVLT